MSDVWPLAGIQRLPAWNFWNFVFPISLRAKHSAVLMVVTPSCRQNTNIADASVITAEYVAFPLGDRKMFRAANLADARIPTLI